MSLNRRNFITSASVAGMVAAIGGKAAAATAEDPLVITLVIPSPVACQAGQFYDQLNLAIGF